MGSSTPAAVCWAGLSHDASGTLAYMHATDRLYTSCRDQLKTPGRKRWGKGAEGGRWAAVQIYVTSSWLAGTHNSFLFVTTVSARREAENDADTLPVRRVKIHMARSSL